MFGTLRKLFPKAQPPGTFTGAACLSPVKPGLPTAPPVQYQRSQGSPQPSAQHQQSQGSPQPQHSTSKARAPHSPPAQYQQSQGSPQPPSTVPAKPGLPTAPQHSTSEARAPHSPQHSEACLPQPVTCLTACLPHSLDLYSLNLYLLDIYTFIWKHSS